MVARSSVPAPPPNPIFPQRHLSYERQAGRKKDALRKRCRGAKVCGGARRRYGAIHVVSLSASGSLAIADDCSSDGRVAARVANVPLIPRGNAMKRPCRTSLHLAASAAAFALALQPSPI